MQINYISNYISKSIIYVVPKTRVYDMENLVKVMNVKKKS